MFYEYIRFQFVFEFALQSDQFYEKAKASNQKKFGVDWALSNPEIKKKTMKTMTERYGAPTTLQSKQLYDKYKATMESKYGKSNPSKIDQFTEKAKQTMIERYGKENPMISKLKFLEYVQSSDLEGDLEFCLGGNSYDLHITEQVIYLVISMYIYKYFSLALQYSRHTLYNNASNVS